MTKIIYGDEPYILDKVLEKEKEGKDVVVYDNMSSDILLDMSTPSFFREKIIILKIATLSDIDVDFLIKTNRNSGRLIILPERVDKRLSIYKKAAELNLLLECSKLSRKDLESFIASYIKKIGKIPFTSELMEIFLTRTNYEGEYSNLYSIELSLDKIFSYSGNRGCTVADIEAAIEDISDGNTFNIIQYIQKGDILKLEREISLIPKGNGLMVLGLILSKFRLAYKASFFKNVSETSKAIGCASYAIPSFQCGNEVLMHCLDIIMKGIKELKQWESDETTVVRYCFLQLLYVLKKERRK